MPEFLQLRMPTPNPNPNQAPVTGGEARHSGDAAATPPMASPASPLFRPEALQAQQVQWLGSIRIGRNPRFALVAWVSLLLAAALIAFAA